MKTAYNIGAYLTRLVRGLKVSTSDDYEKIKRVIDTAKKMDDEFNEKVVKDVLKEFNIKGELKPTHKKFKDVNNALNERYTGASSVNVEQFQVFTREELHAKIDGKEMDFEERDLLETLLVKKDENE